MSFKCCSDNPCFKSESLLEGTFVLSTGKKITASMTASGEGPTIKDAQCYAKQNLMTTYKAKAAQLRRPRAVVSMCNSDNTNRSVATSEAVCSNDQRF